MSNGLTFVNRRLNSLLGVIPIGAFLIVHLVANYYSTMGKEAFQGTVDVLEGLPFLVVLEIVLIYLPILFHAFFGFYIIYRSKPNLRQMPLFRNYMYYLQRVSGVLTFIFIAWHVWQTRLQVIFGGLDASHFGEHMHAILTNPLWTTFYLIGLTATVFHFSNGLWDFLCTWGITIHPQSKRVSTYVCAVIFLIIMYIGVRAIFGFYSPEFAAHISTLVSTL